MDDYYYSEPPKGNGFGVASLVLGIVSLVLFCTCINVPIAIVAIIFGVIHINRHTGTIGTAIGGIVTAGISMVLTAVCVITLLVAGSSISSGLFVEPFIGLPGEFYGEDMPGANNLPWESETVPGLQGENDL